MIKTQNKEREIDYLGKYERYTGILPHGHRIELPDIEELQQVPAQFLDGLRHSGIQLQHLNNNVAGWVD